LEDRGHLLIFEPTALEVHHQASTWFCDQEIFDFVGGWLHLMEQPSFRTYVHGWELKAAGLDWQTGILGRCLTGAALAVARLKANQGYSSEEERARAFVDSGAGCRATYFNHSKKLQCRETIPAIPDIPLAAPAARPPSTANREEETVATGSSTGTIP